MLATMVTAGNLPCKGIARQFTMGADEAAFAADLINEDAFGGFEDGTTGY